MCKYYCDNCGSELLPDEGKRIIREKITDECRIKVEIMFARNGVWNAGTFCNRCILLAVTDGKDCRQKRQTRLMTYKKCPFCGGGVHASKHKYGGWFITHLGPKINRAMCAAVELPAFHTEEDAEKEWNLQLQFIEECQ